MSRFASGAASAALGLALAAAAFGARAGSELTRTTAVEIAVVVACGLVLAFAAARGRLADGPGTLTVALFAVLAVITAASIAWSAAPDLSWVEANRTLAYAAVFAAGVAGARLAPSGAPALLRALLLAVALTIGYSLLSRVFPAALAENEVYARIATPFDYWNAVGVTAALAIPPALWLGARRSGHQPLNALAYPLMGLLLVALFLSYSRGALAAAALGTALWLAVVPLRLRSLAVLGLPVAAAAPLIAWALSHDAFTKDYVPLESREAVAGEFGLLLLGMVIALLGSGLAIGFRLSVRAPRIALRRRLGVAALGFSLAAVVFAFASVALSEQGLAGTVSARIQEATNERAATAGGPQRLTQASSARAEYWRQALSVFSERPALGAGAGAFALTRLRYRSTSFAARHAHGYVVQTLSDLGLVGIFVSLALALAWAVAAARAIGVSRLRRGLPASADRLALAALALAAIVFALQSAIDWTWFVPGPTIMALAAAGFVAGRGREEPAPDGTVHAPPAERTLTLVTTAEASDGLNPASPPGQRPSRPDRHRSLALAGAVLVTTGLCAWAVYQPARSEAHAGRALEHIEADRLPEAAREARRAAEIDPLSPRPLLVRAAVEAAAGRERPALELLQRTVREHPSDPQVWLRLASFQLRTLEDPNAALETLRGALYVDPQSRSVQALYYETRAAQRERAATS
ncbi:MAG: O-antigen ligase family protein [Thermoleophilaceae bacterium]|nr:O-antigen ligase family protein [Thermoleophilaceae bacterium]